MELNMNLVKGIINIYIKYKQLLTFMFKYDIM